ncbi:unnamed protein product [Urochloa humidicola]
MRKRGRQASPLSAPSSQGTAVARGADPLVMVRRSRIAPCVTCGLCGGFLRNAAVIPDCLHPFCRQCIVEEFTDNNISCCPKCDIDWGCNPLKKLRPDRSLQHIRSVIFPVKRHKVGGISPLHPAFVSLPSLSNQAHGVDHSAKKADAHLMPEAMNGETETEADERLGTEPSPSLEKIIASSPNTAVAPGAEPAWPDGSQNQQRDEQREEASSALGENESNVEELREAIESSRIEASE